VCSSDLIPGEANAHAADAIAAAALASGARVATARASLADALGAIASRGERAPRILICGSLHLAGHVLALSERTSS
jgi:dihydrofolate synthase/folylpolyglutamate synthase